MPKSLVLGNGSILITFDRQAQVRDFYYPYVGLENQAGAHFVHRIGVWADNKFAWFDDPSWEIHINYQEDTLASDVQAVNHELGVRIDFCDVVYNEKDIFIRKATVHNLSDRQREVKLFFGAEFEMYESHRGDTGYYDPGRNVVIHYKGRRVILINATQGRESFDQFSIGNFGIEGKEGTFKDAEDGLLSSNPVEHGHVDSVIGLTCLVEPGKSKTIFYWLTVGKFVKEAHELNLYVLDKGPEYLMGTARDFWRAWVNIQPFHFQSLDESVVRLFKKSLLIIHTHIDARGSILASGDTDILFQGKDHYAYLWPRDAAFAAMALDRAGDHFLAKKFFEFCNHIITDEGYFMHRYRADQSLGSSWHPWVRDGKPELPIQEDETALIVIGLWQYYCLSKDLEFIEEIYNNMIKRAAEFMVLHRDSNSGLPKPSYDLWEEKFGIHTYTAATVFASLLSASKFAALLGKTEAEARYRNAALEIQKGILRYLYDEKEGYFYKSVKVYEKGTDADKTVDISSAFGIFRFGVLSPNDEKVTRAMAKARQKLTVPGSVGGICRYENDKYFTVFSDRAHGNAWFVTTLWLAQYLIATAQKEEDFNEVKDILAWVVRYSLSSGLMSEQLHPETGEPISVSPLIWSHCEFVSTVLKYLDKLEELGICQGCNPVK